MAINKNKIIAQAQKLTARGQFEKAVVEYQKLLKADPNDIRTWLKMGDLYTRMGARKEATDTYLKVAEHYKKSGFHLKAVAVYKQVLKLDPTLIDVYELLGDAYLSLGLTSEALIQLEQLADMFQRMENTERMLGVLSRMAEIDPQNISTRLRIAEAYSKEGMSAEAVAQFGVACDQLREHGRMDDFLKVAERLLYHDSSHVDLAREAAGLYLEGGQFKRALSKLQICFAKDPRDLATLELLAEAFVGLKQPDKAVSVYHEMVHLLADQGREPDRQRILEIILTIDPHNKAAHEALGRSLVPPPSEPERAKADSLPSPARAAAGAIPEPASTGKTAADLSELSDEEAATLTDKIVGEAEVLLKYGLHDRAVDHLHKVFEFDFYNLEARERVKDLLLEAGDQERALEQLFILADGFAAEQPEGAVYYLHQALEIDPGSERAREFLKRIGGVLPEHLSEHAEDDLAIADDLIVGEAIPMPETPAGPPAAEAYELSIDDIPYLAPDGALTEFDLEGGNGNLLGGDEDLVEFDEASSELDIVDLGAGTEASDIIDLSDAEIADDLDFGDDEGPIAPEPQPVVSAPPPPPPPKPAIPVPSKAPAPLPRPGAPKQPKAPTLPRPPKPSASTRPPAPPPEPKPPAADGLPAIDDELEEIEFFIEQELFDEARGIVDDLSRRYPDDQRVRDAAAALAAALAPPAPPEPPSREDAPLDLDSLAEGIEIEDVSHDEIVSEFDEVFSQFKAGVQEQVSSSDFATHFDLGVAYKEMGLFEDAIGEFRIAGDDPMRTSQCATMIGICLVSLERFDDAIAELQEGLEIEDLPEHEHLALLYELGRAYEAKGDTDAAIGVFNKVLITDPGFADVADRIDALEG